MRAACSVGKWPRALTERRNRAFSDSIVRHADQHADLLVEAQERDELGPGALPEPDDGGYFASHCPLNSASASSAADSDGAAYTGRSALAMASQSRRLA